ncbi:hypothetical protein UFOVP190_204 [uncultured Caudovirales phage]|uniref:Uncharacterized protein n=1 Tax=uncultured Caudovirales phage TaxID=2100421 RepID=A0A6J7WM37_9CAUD|nr:hypothetical protein UFOVP190_204 [uncultured Caudovirales phage]
MKFKSDIDIDFGDRTQALRLLKHTPASINRDGTWVPHNTGIYVTDIPTDPFTGRASLDYNAAEDRGYMKLDFLNVSLYTQIKSEQHLQDLIAQEPEWDRLYDREFCSQLIHIGNHYDTLIKMPEAVNSIPRMAMFLAVIRPAKRHLIGQTWAEVAKTVWEKPAEDEYFFKKSHSLAYAHLVVVNMNLLSNLANKGD